MEGYVVYFDKVIRKESKIHRADCTEYLTREPAASTTKWSEIYPTMGHTEQTSGVTRKAKCCLSP